MTEERFNYAQMMQRAMRQVVLEVLADTAENGLTGGHHFFITIDMNHPGVDVPDDLRSKYPEEMNVVLEHEFEDLAVTSDRFSVSLSFGNVPTTLVIPIEAIKTFADPSANFGWRFETQGAPTTTTPPQDPTEDGDDKPPGDVVSLDTFRKH